MTYLPLYLATSFGMTKPADQLQFNLYCTIVMTGFNILFAFVGGAWSDRIKKRRVFVIEGAIIASSGVFLIALAPLFGTSLGLVALLVGQALIGTGGGLFLAVDMALCLDVLPDQNRLAKDLGVLNIANLLPVSIAPFIAGIIVIPLGNTVRSRVRSVVRLRCGGVADRGPAGLPDPRRPLTRR